MTMNTNVLSGRSVEKVRMFLGGPSDISKCLTLSLLRSKNSFPVKKDGKNDSMFQASKLI